ncbi:MAG: hypothetical protein HY368_01510 [Candidatus Aenigmarchaeota archaeon]|nr:hypothetical protein [Candidatus Aenigmarchaeota archaeon]
MIKEGSAMNLNRGYGVTCQECGSEEFQFTQGWRCCKICGRILDYIELYPD